MTPQPYATCGCGTDTYSELTTQRHAAECDQSGWPQKRCTVTMRRPPKHLEAPCGQPVVGDFCARHEADRARLA